MTDVSQSQDAAPLGTVLCPSGRLAICDWVMMGQWSPASRPFSPDTEGPSVMIQEGMNGITAAVVDGLRPDVAYRVWGEFVRDGWLKGSLRQLSVAIREGIAAQRVAIGTASVLHGRMMAVDAVLNLYWDDDVSTDGLADVVFWGRHEAEVAVEVGAGPILSTQESGTFGWRDLPVDVAVRRTCDLEAMRSQERMFAVDFRPHTEQWRFLERLRQSPTGSIEIEHGSSRLVMFHAHFGHHLCFIDADLDASGRLLRVTVDIERDPFE